MAETCKITSEKFNWRKPEQNPEIIPYKGQWEGGCGTKISICLSNAGRICGNESDRKIFQTKGSEKVDAEL